MDLSSIRQFVKDAAHYLPKYWRSMVALIVAVQVLVNSAVAVAYWPLGTDRVLAEIFETIHFALIGTIPVGAVVLVQKARIAALAASLAKLSMIDPLTGLCNRRELFARLGCASTTDGLAFAFFDIDHFKLINDRFGHQAGDLVLTGFSGLLRAQAPEDALLVRLGGEEFGVLFSSGSPERARLFAERMVTLARITPFDTPAGQLFITVSGGVSFGSASMSADDLVGSADSALYRAKSTGRDRICEAEICAAA